VADDKDDVSQEVAAEVAEDKADVSQEVVAEVADEIADVSRELVAEVVAEVADDKEDVSRELVVEVAEDKADVSQEVVDEVADDKADVSEVVAAVMPGIVCPHCGLGISIKVMADPTTDEEVISQKPIELARELTQAAGHIDPTIKLGLVMSMVGMLAMTTFNCLKR